MRLNVMQVSACVTVMAAAVAAPIVMLKAWPQEATAAPTQAPVAAQEPRDLRFVAVSRENQGMDDPPPAPDTTTNEGGVAFYADDAAAVAFLGLAQPCTDAWGVSMKEFMQMRIRQARGSGIIQTYTLGTDEAHGKQVITVVEDTHLASGKSMPIPETVAYQYVYDWPNVQLIAVTPRTSSVDPLAFFQARRSAACDGKLQTLES